LPSVKEQKHDFIFFRSMYNKTITRFGFCDIQNNRGLGKGYRPQPSIILDITKTLSCILSRHDIMDDKHTVVARNKL